jgi:hypothetical protein
MGVFRDLARQMMTERALICLVMLRGNLPFTGQGH